MKTVEDIIKEKAFHQLSQVERLEVLQMVEDENEFMEVKRFLLSLETMQSNEETAPIEISAKNNLDALFAQKHPVISIISDEIPSKEKERKIIPLYRKLLWPAMVASVCSFGMFIAVKTWNSSNSSAEIQVQANNGGKVQKTVEPTKKEIIKVEETPLIAKVDEPKSSSTTKIFWQNNYEYEKKVIFLDGSENKNDLSNFSIGYAADLNPSIVGETVAFEESTEGLDNLMKDSEIIFSKPTIEEMLSDIVTAF